jgi:hypothetical protein
MKRLRAGEALGAAARAGSVARSESPVTSSPPFAQRLLSTVDLVDTGLPGLNLGSYCPGNHRPSIDTAQRRTTRTAHASDRTCSPTWYVTERASCGARVGASRIRPLYAPHLPAGVDVIPPCGLSVDFLITRMVNHLRPARTACWPGDGPGVGGGAARHRLLLDQRHLRETPSLGLGGSRWASRPPAHRSRRRARGAAGDTVHVPFRERPGKTEQLGGDKRRARSGAEEERGHRRRNAPDFASLLPTRGPAEHTQGSRGGSGARESARRERWLAADPGGGDEPVRAVPASGPRPSTRPDPVLGADDGSVVPSVELLNDGLDRLRPS